ncbi:MAG: hypothetical protein LH610_06945 [Sphingomonas bacterium]|nr:hypothetical protein [Sphingomonas bacterium]
MLREPGFEPALLAPDAWSAFPGSRAAFERDGFSGDLQFASDWSDLDGLFSPLWTKANELGEAVTTKDGDRVMNDGGTVVVTGTRYLKIDPYTWWDSGPGADYWTVQLDGGGDGGFDREFLQILEDCQKDREADGVKDEINSAPQDGNERGAITYIDADGNIVTTPISAGAPGTVAVLLPPGVSMSQVIGFIHSHPAAPRSGDPVQDALYDEADVYPSPDDWDQMDAMIAGGANASTLSFYVIDMNGVVREYNYSDKAIYDVPVEQLLGIVGTPPPVPELMSEDGGC